MDKKGRITVSLMLISLAFVIIMGSAVIGSYSGEKMASAHPAKVIRPGTYSTLVITENTELKPGAYTFTGSGGGFSSAIQIKADNVKLSCNGAVIRNAGAAQTAIEARQLTGVTVEGCTIRGFISGIDFRDVRMMAISGNTIKTTPDSYGAAITAASEGYTGSSGTVANNQVIGSGGNDGIAIIQSESAGVNVKNNRVCGFVRDWLCNLAYVFDAGGNVGTSSYGCAAVALTPC